METGHPDTYKAATLALGGLASMAVASFLMSYLGVPPAFLSIPILLQAAAVYYFLHCQGPERSRAATVITVLSYLFTAVVIFHPTAWSVFRGEEWFITALFKSSSGSMEDLKRISLFEIFGDVRFQPLAHLMLYARYLVFGDNLFLYNGLNIILHASVAYTVFAILFRLLADRRVAYVCGLFFISLPAQFDTVVWTYHLYIIVGVLFVNLAVYLTYLYVVEGRRRLIIAAFVLALLSVFLYEPFLTVPAGLFLFVCAFRLFRGEGFSKRELARVAVLAAAAYAVYLAISLYGVSLAGESRFSTTDLLSFTNVSKAVKSLLICLWESVFLKNIGVATRIVIDDIIWLYMKEGWYKDLLPLIQVAIGAGLVCFFTISRKNFLAVATLVLLGLTYLFIISLGRAFTNELYHLPSQPRYLYYPGALTSLLAGLLVCRRFQGERLRPAILALFMVVLIGNTVSSLNLVEKTREAISPQDEIYYRMKDFVEAEPGALIFPNMVISNGEEFFFGADAMPEVLLEKNITRSLWAATHLFDGRTFRENPYRKESTPPSLNDFTVSWVYFKYLNWPPEYGIDVVGSEGVYPRVSVVPDGPVRVDVLDSESGEVSSYVLEYHNTFEDDDLWYMMIVEKYGDELCLLVNGRLASTSALRSVYRPWSTDGLDTLGSYYRGEGAAYISGLFIQRDFARFGCRDIRR